MTMSNSPAELQMNVRQTLIADHQAFLKQKGRTLIGNYPHDIFPMAQFINALPPGELTPEELMPEKLEGALDAYCAGVDAQLGDLFNWVSPLNGFPWMEAIVGCRIVVSQDSSSVWAEPPADFEPEGGVRLNAAWLAVLLAFTEKFNQRFKDDLPLAPGIMRGVSDLLAALLGTSAFYLTLYDSPDTLKALALQLAQLWVDVIREQVSHISPWMGGFVNAGIWFPAPVPVYQEDAGGLISPHIFEAVLGDACRQCLAAFPGTIMHLHASGLQIIPSLKTSQNLSVIEVNLDPNGPAVDDILPVLAGVQQHHPLEVFGRIEEIKACQKALRPASLACLIQKD